jgi:hypothetical protein
VEVMVAVVVINHLKNFNMKVTRDIIACQNFENEFADKNGKFIIYTKKSDDKFCVVFWIDEENILGIHHFPSIGDDSDKCEIVSKLIAIKMLLKVGNNDLKPDNDDKSLVFFGIIPHVGVLLKVFVDYGVVSDGVLALPNDIDERFIQSDFDYDEKTFELFSKMLLNVFNEYEDYEKSSKVWKHYTEVKQQKNWVNECIETI